jgi:hypothetical protein
VAAAGEADRAAMQAALQGADKEQLVSALMGLLKGQPNVSPQLLAALGAGGSA